MDEADMAQSTIEADLERHIQAARGQVPAHPRRECVDCGIELPEHRRQWGICIECKQIREARDRMWGVGV